MMLKALCPECDHEILFSSPPRLKGRLSCAKCRSELLIIQLDPLALDWAFMEPFGDSVHSDEYRQATNPESG